MKPRISMLMIALSLLFTVALPANAQQNRTGLKAHARTGANHIFSPSQTASQLQSQKFGTNPHDARYNVVRIGVLPGKTNSYLAEGKTLNNLGHLTGLSYAFSGGDNDIFLTSQGFLWSNGQLHALPLLPGWPSAYGLGLNNRDQVIGLANKIDNDGNFLQTAVLWDHGHVTALGSLFPNSNSYPFDINLWGVVAGGNQNPATNDNLPVVWYGGGIHQLPLLPGMDRGFAESINDVGMIAGRQAPPDGSSQIACLWYWNGAGYTPVNLGNFGGNYSEALGINNLGQIVGWSALPGDLHASAFVWDWRGLHALPSLPGDTDAQGNDISDLNQIVGFSFLFDDNGNLISERVALWEHNTVTELQSLVPPGTPTFTDVGHANLLGQIDADSGSLGDGTSVGYLLVPTH